MDLWLLEPVTQAYLRCLDWAIEQNQENIKTLSFVADTNDETLRNLFASIGVANYMAQVSSPYHVLGVYGLLKESDDD